MTVLDEFIASGRPGSDCQCLVEIDEPEHGLLAWICLHRQRNGRSMGGIRRRRYERRIDAIGDAAALAQGMSRKLAIARLPVGGAKTVVFDSPGIDQARAYARLGWHIERLDAAYVCGGDVGTGAPQLEYVRHECRFVDPLGNDGNAATAQGVLTGVQVALEHLDGSAEVRGKVFCIEGLGAVGAAIASKLLAGGATVYAFDPARERVVDPVAQRVHWVSSALDLARVACDVWLPCAVGGTVSLATVEALAARVICGAANQPLADDALAQRLADRGILYVPDFAVNSGAVIQGYWTFFEPDRAQHGISQTNAQLASYLRRLLDESRTSGKLPLALALRDADHLAGPATCQPSSPSKV